MQDISNRIIKSESKIKSESRIKSKSKIKNESKIKVKVESWQEKIESKIIERCR